MTTYVPHETTRDERVREAWTSYRNRLVELQGPEYEAAEEESWARLQRALRRIDRDLGGPAAAAGRDRGTRR
jgi:hypothetical protein